MLTRRILGIAGAIGIGLLAGIHAARAVLNLDAGTGGFVVAKETFTPTGSVAVPNRGTYYTVIPPSTGPGARRLVAVAAMGVAVNANSTDTVTFTLRNMTFAGATAPTLETTEQPTPRTFTLSSGGTDGDTTAVFSLTQSSSISATQGLVLDIRGVAVAPDAAGGIRMTVSGSPGHQAEFASAVGVESALRESATPAIPRTLLPDGFRNFEAGSNVRADRLAASVGNVSVTALTRYPDPDGLVVVSASSTPITDTTALLGSSPGTVTIEGDVSFATGVFWYDNADCTTDEGGTAPSNLLTIANDGGRTLSTVSVTDVDGKHLCIEVDGTTAIPQTLPYSVTLAYGNVPGAVFPPGDVTLTLGGITRGGVSAHIPYLTTFSAYNQRIVIVNRGTQAVQYAFEFIEEGHATRNTTPIAQGRATGLLQPGVTNFRTRDLVDFAEDAQGRKWPRTAAILTVDADPETISVITNQVYIQDGTTDTVEYELE